MDLGNRAGKAAAEIVGEHLGRGGLDVEAVVAGIGNLEPLVSARRSDDLEGEVETIGVVRRPAQFLPVQQGDASLVYMTVDGVVVPTIRTALPAEEELISIEAVGPE